ncbi:hypothetical protein F5Y18DRAFT_381968 [Xylariaceae sp. FL1019]|nr:hypothetical protein F5Y18DRAFT_381968 [Xylariaceae sp. FL1019]
MAGMLRATETGVDALAFTLQGLTSQPFKSPSSVKKKTSIDATLDDAIAGHQAWARGPVSFSGGSDTRARLQQASSPFVCRFF